ncbi:hypothetical protein R3P38DRAFT_3361752 [Favolaschia claudopus]|uniref:Uncharacterized protein n=1 Tax=Favolaschia claudopus TaxID=2862362 RepID=A0AAW0ARM4_9AGAR
MASTVSTRAAVAAVWCSVESLRGGEGFALRALGQRGGGVRGRDDDADAVADARLIWIHRRNNLPSEQVGARSVETTLFWYQRGRRPRRRLAREGDVDGEVGVAFRLTRRSANKSGGGGWECVWSAAYVQARQTAVYALPLPLIVVSADVLDMWVWSEWAGGMRRRSEVDLKGGLCGGRDWSESRGIGGKFDVGMGRERVGGGSVDASPCFGGLGAVRSVNVTPTFVERRQQQAHRAYGRDKWGRRGKMNQNDEK